MKQIAILVFALFFIPQINYAQAKNGFFNTTEEYLDDTVQKTGFDRTKIIIEDFTNNDEFTNDIISNNLFTFYGVAYNDKLISAATLENKSCWGQFLELCKNVKEGDSDVNNRKIVDIPYLKNIKFDKSKKTVIFLYLSTLNKRNVKKHIKPILVEVQKDPSFDYIVLLLDYNRVIN